MSLPFTARQRINPQDPEAAKLYYPAPKYNGEIDIDDISDEISDSSSLTQSDVLACIRALLNNLPKYMLLGYKVRMDGLGIFKLSFSGTGHEKAEDVSASEIEGLRIIFTPDPKIKQKISRPEFVKA